VPCNDCFVQRGTFGGAVRLRLSLKPTCLLKIFFGSLTSFAISYHCSHSLSWHLHVDHELPRFIKPWNEDCRHPHPSHPMCLPNKQICAATSINLNSPAKSLWAIGLLIILLWESDHLASRGSSSWAAWWWWCDGIQEVRTGWMYNGVRCCTSCTSLPVQRSFANVN